MEQKRPSPQERSEADRTFRGSWSGYERDCLFHNFDGPAPRFHNMAYLYGLDFDDDGRSVCPVDIDGDGDMDLAIQSLQGLRLLENRMPPKRFARVRLTAASGPASALGAIVRLTAGGVTRQDHVKMTEGFMTQVPLDLHFGLGSATAIDRVLVLWPSGGMTELRNLPVDRLLEIREGAEEARVSELPRWKAGARPKVPPAFSFDLSAEKLQGGSAPLATPGTPVVVNFWSPDCAPCKEELPALGALAARLGTTVQFVGVSLETTDMDSVRAAVAGFALPYPQVLANDTLVRSFFGRAERIPIPATFVFDGAGRLRRAFLDVLREGELEAVLRSFREEPVQIADLESRASSLSDLGRYEEAIPWLEKVIAEAPDRPGAHFLLGVARGGQAEGIVAGASDPGQLREAEARARPYRERAMASFRRCLELEPEHGLAWYNLGLLLHRFERYAEAVPCYQEALRLRGEDRDTLVSLALAAGGAGQTALAFDAVDRALKADPKNTAAWMARANILGKSGQKDQARKALEELLRIDPDHAEARRILESLKGR